MGDIDAGQTGDPDAGGISTATCDDYCTAIMTNCTGANAQYPDMGACMTVCEGVGWESGQVNAQEGNSIACRVYHAGDPAAGEPETHCVHAGPAGGDTCGSWCDVYCALNLRTCTGRNAQYADEAECQAACAGFADDGEAGDDMGDTVQCRITHSGYPAFRDPGTECPYTGEEPVNYCIDFVGF